jgi:hypothetical protein
MPTGRIIFREPGLISEPKNVKAATKFSRKKL